MVAFDLEEVIEEEKQIDDQIKEHTEMLITVEAEIEQVKYLTFVKQISLTLSRERHMGHRPLN